jgi:hypothetical protein
MTEQLDFNFEKPEEKVKRLKQNILEKRAKGEKRTPEETEIENEEIEEGENLKWFQK